VWELAGPESTVHMPGGSVGITLGDPVLLVGDATFIASVEVP
jgi:diaminopimelate epimerase